MVKPVSRAGVPNTAVIYPGAFLCALAEGMLNLGIVFFLRERYAASPSLIGWFMGFSVLVYILACLLLRPVFDRLQPQVPILIGAAGMPLFLLLLYLLPSLPLTFLFSALHRIALSFFWPPSMGWLSRGIEGEHLSRRQTRFSLSWSTGLVSSYALSGLASERAAALPVLLSIVIFSASLLILVAALAAFPHLRPSGGQVLEPPGKDRVAGEGTPLRFPAWTGIFASYIVSGMIASVFPLFARDFLGASKSLVGALISTRTLTQSLGFLLLGAVSFWHYRGRFILLSQLYWVLLLAVMLLARSVAFFAVLFPFIGLASAASYAGGLFHGIAGSSRRAGRMAIHESVLNGGYIVGASASGFLYQEFSMTAVVLFCLSCSAAAIAAQGTMLVVFRNGRRTPLHSQ